MPSGAHKRKRPDNRGAPKLHPVRSSGGELGRLDLQDFAGARDRDRPGLHCLWDLAHQVDVQEPGGNGAIYYGLGVTEHSQGSTTVMAIANLAMATGNIGRPGVGVNPLRGQNNVQGSCDMGSFPHELAGYRHISGDAGRATFESLWGVKLDKEPGLRIPNMLDAAVDG